MKAYTVKKNVLVHDSPPHPVQIGKYTEKKTFGNVISEPRTPELKREKHEIFASSFLMSQAHMNP
jgi:hypothetical protein